MSISKDDDQDREAYNMNKLKLWQYNEDCGRMGSLDGLFIMSEEDLKKYYQKKFYWSEVLGKHSEGYFTLCGDTLTDLEVPSEVVQVLLDKVGVVISGDLDFDYFDEQIEEMSGDE